MIKAFYKLKTISAKVGFLGLSSVLFASTFKSHSFLQEATEDILDRITAAPNNVVYAEIRFCPSLHTLEGLTSDQAVRAVIRGQKG